MSRIPVIASKMTTNNKKERKKLKSMNKKVKRYRSKIKNTLKQQCS